MAISLVHNRSGFFDEGIEALKKLYNIGFDQYGNSSDLTESTELWLQIAIRLFALGGLAIRTKRWGYIHRLVDRPRTDGEFARHISWLRHAFTQASRVVFSRNPDRESSLIRLATDYTTCHPQLNPEGEDANLTSICEFDFAACLIAAAQPQFNSMTLCYPSFARYRTHRIEPFVMALVNNRDMREQIIGFEDAELAYALQLLNQYAAGEAFRFGGWTQFRDVRICSFINDPQHKTAYTRMKLLRQLFELGQGNSAYFDPGSHPDDDKMSGVYRELRRMKAEKLVEGSISSNNVLASVRLTSAGEHAAADAKTSLLLRVQDDFAIVANLI
jgi:hypothetical protein